MRGVGGHCSGPLGKIHRRNYKAVPQQRDRRNKAGLAVQISRPPARCLAAERPTSPASAIIQNHNMRKETLKLAGTPDVAVQGVVRPTRQTLQQRRLKRLGLCVRCWKPTGCDYTMCSICREKRTNAVQATAKYKSLHWRPNGRPRKLA
jgi:hypothetical protein